MVLMVVQQKMFMPPPTNDDQKNQQNIMLYMSVFMSVVFYRVPAGLCFYFITSSVWGLAERQLLKPAKGADMSSLLQVKVTDPNAKPSWFTQWINLIREKIEQQNNPKKIGKKR
jgi:YidC/Oxa1 family membrane protein insertase